MLNPMDFSDFLAKLQERHGKVYPKQWTNYPNSIFYYTIPDPKTTDEEVGIYTNETHYFIKGESI